MAQAPGMAQAAGDITDDKFFEMILQWTDITDLDIKVGLKPNTNEVDARPTMRALFSKKKDKLIKLARGGFKDNVLQMAGNCGADSTDAALIAQSMVEKFYSPQFEDAMAKYDSIEKVEKKVSDIIDSKSLDGAEYTIKVRKKDVRSKESVEPRLCLHQMPFFEVNSRRGEVFDLLTEYITEPLSISRNQLFGLYGGSGIGKSHCMDYFCGEYAATSKLAQSFVFIPITVNDAMKLVHSEAHVTVTPELISSIIIIRVIYCYFVAVDKQDTDEKDSDQDSNKNANQNNNNNNNNNDVNSSNNSKRKPNTTNDIITTSGSKQEVASTRALAMNRTRSSSVERLTGIFTTFHSLFSGTKGINVTVMGEIFRLIISDIKQNGKQMVLVIDDLSSWFNKTGQELFLEEAQKMMDTYQIKIICVNVFQGEPLIKPSGGTVQWVRLSGMDLSEPIIDRLQSKYSSRFDQFKLKELCTLFSFFGDHPRQRAILYHAIREESELHELIFENNKQNNNGIRRAINYTKILNILVDKYFRKNVYGNVVSMLTALFSDKYASAFEYFLCLFILGERYNEEYALDKFGKKAIAGLVNHGIVEKEKNSSYCTVPAVSLFVLSQIEYLASKDDKNKKQVASDNFSDFGQNMIKIFFRLFELLVVDWSAQVAEELVCIQYLMKLNCLKYFYEINNGKTGRVTLGDEFLLSKGRANFYNDKIYWDRIDWQHLKYVKTFPEDFFAGFTKNDKKNPVKVDFDLYRNQLHKINFGVATFEAKNIGFDLLLVLPVGPRNKRLVYIEVKSTKEYDRTLSTEENTTEGGKNNNKKGGKNKNKKNNNDTKNKLSNDKVDRGNSKADRIVGEQFEKFQKMIASLKTIQDKENIRGVDPVDAVEYVGAFYYKFESTEKGDGAMKDFVLKRILKEDMSYSVIDDFILKMLHYSSFAQLLKQLVSYQIQVYYGLQEAKKN